MAPEERQAYVKDKLEKRETIQRRVAAVSKKRDTWVREEQARLASEGAVQSFDSQVLDTIRNQAEAKGITY